MVLKLLVKRQSYLIGNYQLNCGRGIGANSPPGGAICIMGGGAATKVTSLMKPKNETRATMATKLKIDRTIGSSWRITVQNPDLSCPNLGLPLKIAI